jgi:catechol 2,3-dioxygenase-like lactoylglutathione lyase family enzyme
MPVTFNHTVPILRMFSVEKAKEFYVGWLGFKVDWEHEFEPDTPKYMQVSRGGLVFHLSEHYGDGTPGTAVYVDMQGVKEFHAEISARKYKYYRPAVERTPWDTWAMDLLDPFGNKLRFNERADPE